MVRRVEWIGSVGDDPCEEMVLYTENFTPPGIFNSVSRLCEWSENGFKLEGKCDQLG